MAPPVRLLLSDVDGTLVTSEKFLTPATIAAVARLHDAGIAFAVTSSRPPRGMAMLVEPLRITTPLAGFNGGTLVAPDFSHVIETRNVPEDAARIAVESLAGAGVDVWVFADNEWLVTNPTGDYVPRETRTVQFSPRTVDDFTPFLDRAGKIVGSSKDFDLLARCETDLQAGLAGRASAHRSQKYYLDVTHADANKGHAVRAMARHLGISENEIACIGDMTNDLAMFAVAGFSIAMGNGPDEVRGAASVVTESNDHDGFAAAVDAYILPRAAGAAA